MSLRIYRIVLGLLRLIKLPWAVCIPPQLQGPLGFFQLYSLYVEYDGDVLVVRTEGDVVAMQERLQMGEIHRAT